MEVRNELAERVAEISLHLAHRVYVDEVVDVQVARLKRYVIMCAALSHRTRTDIITCEMYRGNHYRSDEAEETLAQMSLDPSVPIGKARCSSTPGVQNETGQRDSRYIGKCRFLNKK